MQKLEEKYLFSYQQVISTSFSVHSWLLRKTNTQTTKFPIPLLPLSFYFVTCYSLSFVWVSCPGYIPSQTFTQWPLGGGWREPWRCTCTAEHQLKRWRDTNTALELHGTAPRELLWKVTPSQPTPVQQLNASDVEDSPGTTWQWEQRPKCLHSVSHWHASLVSPLLKCSSTLPLKI